MIIAVPTVIPNYFVLDTDYSSYSIVYDCFDVLGVAKAGWSNAYMLTESGVIMNKGTVHKLMPNP